MPRGDKTGPKGNGPMTGRRNGNCVNNNFSENFGFGRGNGRGRNMNSETGRMFRNRQIGFNSENQADKSLFDSLMEEIANLKNQIANLKKED